MLLFPEAKATTGDVVDTFAIFRAVLQSRTDHLAWFRRFPLTEFRKGIKSFIKNS